MRYRAQSVAVSREVWQLPGANVAWKAVKATWLYWGSKPGANLVG